MFRRCLTVRAPHSKALLSFRSVHDSAKNGFTAAAAESYEKGRPEYTLESLQQIGKILRKSGPPQDISTKSGYRILELGAGTGKFTQSFVRFSAQLHNVVLDYIATEPSSGFRERLVKKRLRDVTVEDGTGDKIPSGPGRVHMVVAAQAFHWMDNQSTLNEVHRVLGDKCSLVMIWNSYDYSKDWMKQLDAEILTPAYGPEVPRQQNEKWRNCFFAEPARKMFTPIHTWESPYVHRGDRSMVWNRIFSTSVIVERNAEEQKIIGEKLNNILDHHPDLAEARETGRFEIPYVTHLSWVYKI